MSFTLNHLTFTGSFDGGNLKSVRAGGKDEYLIYILKVIRLGCTMDIDYLALYFSLSFLSPNLTIHLVF
jgi:hypothetical protein